MSCRVKRAGHPWCVQALVRVLLDAGHAKIILRGDGEPAIVALDSQSNGLAEVAVRDVNGVARSLHYDMAKLHDVDIPREHPILMWMVHYAGSVITRGQLGKDGMTAFQRWKGQRFKGPLPPFAECILYLPAGKRGSEVDEQLSLRHIRRCRLRC